MKKIAIFIFFVSFLSFQNQIKAKTPKWYFHENTGTLIGKINSTGTTKRCYKNDLGLLIIHQLSLTAIADTDLSQLQVGLMIIDAALKWDIYHTSFSATGLTGVGAPVKKKVV